MELIRFFWVGKWIEYILSCGVRVLKWRFLIRVRLVLDFKCKICWCLGEVFRRDDGRMGEK